jgi:hypothetical protein
MAFGRGTGVFSSFVPPLSSRLFLLPGSPFGWACCGLLPRSLQENMRRVAHVISLPEPSFLASILRRFGEGGQGATISG